MNEVVGAASSFCSSTTAAGDPGRGGVKSDFHASEGER